MSIVIVSCLLSIWTCFGWRALAFARIGDDMVRGMLAPGVGMAIVTLATTTSSLAGLPIDQSKWIILALFAASSVADGRAGWVGFGKIAGFQASLLVLNLCTVALGLVVFGLSWQGLINEDGATNAMGAQYFMTHAFFAIPHVQSIVAGLDYSPLSSMLFVAGGSRFGDVMLLGFSASLFNLNPDQVYMAHALAIRCAMIASSALLIYHTGTRWWKLIVAAVVLTLDPLNIYSYVNELISQMGGFTLLITAALLFQALADRPETFRTAMWPIAIVVAALFQMYPESISFLAFVLFLLGLYRIRRGTLPPGRDVAKAGMIIGLVVLAALNVSLPNVLSHMMGAMGAVGAAQELNLSKSLFGFAFTPDFLPILFGFLHLGERFGEPWALSFQLVSGALACVLVIFAALRFTNYPLLIASSAAAVVAFAFLSWQRTEFGTFKMMLFAQPLLFGLIAALIIDLIVIRKLLTIIAGMAVLLLIGRGAYGYVLSSLTEFGAVPQFAKYSLMM